MVELRRAFHREPERAFEGEPVAKVVVAELDRLGIPYDYGGVGGIHHRFAWRKAA